MAIENVEDLELIFGSESNGNTPEERALSSSRKFVRSQVQLAVDSHEASGRKLSAWEALKTFGIEKLREVIEYGSAIIIYKKDEPAMTLHSRREALDLTVAMVAKVTGLSKKEVNNAENPKKLTSIHVIEKIAQALALDENTVSFIPGAEGDSNLAARLKSLGETQFSQVFVSQLCEAAWVSRKQYELFSWVYSQPPISLAELGFHPSDNYGG